MIVGLIYAMVPRLDAQIHGLRCCGCMKDPRPWQVGQYTSYGTYAQSTMHERRRVTSCNQVQVRTHVHEERIEVESHKRENGSPAR